MNIATQRWRRRRLIQEGQDMPTLVPIRVPIPWDIQHHIIESLQPLLISAKDDLPIFDKPTSRKVPFLRPMRIIQSQMRIRRTLRSWSLVCRDWAFISQRILFRWICLYNHRETDSLYAILRDPRSSHLSQMVHRLSIDYCPPYKGIGGALPRIIGMNLSQLEHLDICANYVSGRFECPLFPFHPSLRAQLSRLDQVRILHLYNIRFLHFAELRRLVCAFAGIRHLVLVYVTIGRDNLGDFRSIHRTNKWQVPAKVSWLPHIPTLYEQEQFCRTRTPLVFWVANIPRSHQGIQTSSTPSTSISSRAIHPALTSQVATTIDDSFGDRPFGAMYLDTWQWRRGEGSRDRVGGECVCNLQQFFIDPN